MSSEHGLNQERGLDARNPFLIIIGAGVALCGRISTTFALFTFSFLAIISLLHMLRNDRTIPLAQRIIRHRRVEDVWIRALGFENAPLAIPVIDNADRVFDDRAEGAP